MPDVFLDGVSCLGEDESAEGELETRHNCCLTNQANRRRADGA
jgi:hypothetical protein